MMFNLYKNPRGFAAGVFLCLDFAFAWIIRMSFLFAFPDVLASVCWQVCVGKCVRVIEKVGKSGVIFVLQFPLRFLQKTRGGGSACVQPGSVRTGSGAIPQRCIYESLVAENSDEMLCGICGV